MRTPAGKPKSRKDQHKLIKILLMAATLSLVILCVVLGYSYIIDKYHVNTVYVEGNIHYSDDEIKQIVMKGKYGDNSLFLSHKYSNKSIEDVPFVETMSVSIVSPDTIRISVYEKALAGYVEYLGRYVYFDKDGIVVESSQVKTLGIPEVIGVDFDYVVMYEKLPVENDDIFNKVLGITQLLTKYKVSAEKIYFADSGDISLYCQNVVVKLGKEVDLDIKIMNIPSILNKLDGIGGTLRMENYDEDTRNVSFEPDKSYEEIPINSEGESDGEQSDEGQSEEQLQEDQSVE